MVQRGNLPSVYFLQWGGCNSHGARQLIFPFPSPHPITSAAIRQGQAGLHLPGPEGCSSAFPTERCPRSSQPPQPFTVLTLWRKTVPEGWKVCLSPLCWQRGGTQTWAPLKTEFKDTNRFQCVLYWHQLATMKYLDTIKRPWRLPVSCPGDGQSRCGPGCAQQQSGSAAPRAAQPWSVLLVPVCFAPEHRDPQKPGTAFAAAPPVFH